MWLKMGKRFQKSPGKFTISIFSPQTFGGTTEEEVNSKNLISTLVALVRMGSQQAISHRKTRNVL